MDKYTLNLSKNIKNSLGISLALLPIYLSASNIFSVPITGHLPPLLLAKNFKLNSELSDFFVSEKLDGIRAFWSGDELLTRNGHNINAPDWFVETLPNQALDGELWIGRGRFDEVSGIARRKNAIDQEWKKVKFMAFDLPYDLAPFEDRFKTLDRIVKEKNLPHLKLVKQSGIKSKEDLDRYLALVTAKGGEGLMLHKKYSLYQAKRSDDLQKLKPLYDAEATVLRHLNGKGKYLNHMGSIEVINKDGIIFKIGSGFNFQERKNPPAIGSIITYQYRGKTKNNTPRFATFLREYHQD